jgi:hypothetical protein
MTPLKTILSARRVFVLGGACDPEAAFGAFPGAFGESGFRSVQMKLKLLDELRHLQTVGQAMVRMNRDRHGSASIRFRDLPERDARRGVLMGKVARMGDGSEIEPGKRRKPNEVRLRVALYIGALPHALCLRRGSSHEIAETLLKSIGCEPNGYVGASHGAAAMNLLVAPDFTIDNSGMEIFYLMGCGECPVDKRQKDGEAVVFGVAMRGRALNPEANAMVWLREILEEVEDIPSLPGRQVDLLPLIREGFLHSP